MVFLSNCNYIVFKEKSTCATLVTLQHWKKEVVCGHKRAMIFCSIKKCYESTSRTFCGYLGLFTVHYASQDQAARGCYFSGCCLEEILLDLLEEDVLLLEKLNRLFLLLRFAISWLHKGDQNRKEILLFLGGMVNYATGLMLQRKTHVCQLLIEETNVSCRWIFYCEFLIGRQILTWIMK